MILTQTLYGKVSSLVAQRESQALEETMTLAHNVLKQAHRRGVELEGILEVRGMTHSRSSCAFMISHRSSCFSSRFSLLVLEQTYGRLQGFVQTVGGCGV